MDLFKTYNELLEELGPQGWWPVTSKDKPEYHKGDYSYPRNETQQWEVCMGAILTQNTSWRNVEKALASLKGQEDIDSILRMRVASLARIIRSSGYYNQKAAKLKEFAETVQEAGGVKNFLGTVSREQLLSISGIGPETADSILLYAGKRPYFVVDAYTIKLFRLTGEYEEIQKLFESSLPRDRTVYNEFHALIVQKGKQPVSRLSP